MHFPQYCKQVDGMVDLFAAKKETLKKQLNNNMAATKNKRKTATSAKATKAKKTKKETTEDDKTANRVGL